MRSSFLYAVPSCSSQKRNSLKVSIQTTGNQQTKPGLGRVGYALKPTRFDKNVEEWGRKAGPSGGEIDSQTSQKILFHVAGEFVKFNEPGYLSYELVACLITDRAKAVGHNQGP
jgi:hypothetical protein